jgi:CheY-like chemotaxis protein
MTKTSKIRVLLVDDDPEISWAVGRCLTRASCKVVTCGDGAEAISLLREKAFDIMITDIQMPKLNGLALIEWVARHRQKIRIVAITAFGCPSVQQVVLRKGAILYLEKPFDPNILKDLIINDKERHSFYGNVDNVDLFDYVQLIFHTMRKVLLQVKSADGETGLLFIKNGTACHAECGALRGEEAFYRCMAFTGGSFSTLPWKDPDVETIKIKGEFLLMDAAREKDETSGSVRMNQSEASSKENAGFDFLIDTMDEEKLEDDWSSE